MIIVMILGKGTDKSIQNILSQKEFDKLLAQHSLSWKLGILFKKN